MQLCRLSSAPTSERVNKSGTGAMSGADAAGVMKETEAELDGAAVYDHRSEASDG
jgi:hypothetical protein